MNCEGSHGFKGFVKTARKVHKMKYAYINLEKLSEMEKRLLDLLDEKKEVHFCFWKKDGAGEVRREARGTRNAEYIPFEKWPKNPTDDVGKRINYYDYDRMHGEVLVLEN